MQKQAIKELKKILESSGVPREQWSQIIQCELNRSKTPKKCSPGLLKKAESNKISYRIKNKIENWFQKIISGQFISKENVGNIDESFKAFQNDLPSKNDALSDLLFSKNFSQNLENLGNHSTFVMDRPDKKRKLVKFDDNTDFE